MNYGQCRRYLQEILASGIKFGLDNVRAVLSALGQPHQEYPSVLVAGTNGKGSVCAMLARILSLQGFRVGLYTSPHLVKVEERIRIGDEPISQRSFCRLVTDIRKHVEELIAQGKLANPPTYFEILTCLALSYFQKKKVDIAVLEVGMGGRLDATNVVVPLVSAITAISTDHQEFLGRTLGEIAYEKAGIIKPGVAVIGGLRGGKAYEVVKRRAAELEAPFLPVFAKENDFRTWKTPKGHRFSFRWSGQKFLYAPSLAGEHQGRNAAIAVATAFELGRRWKKINRKTILRGIHETRWPGRLEFVSRKPLVVLDGAHNEEGARALKTYARDFLPQPLTLVFGIMKDKDIPRVARALFPLARTILLTSFPYERAASTEKIKSEIGAIRKDLLLEPDTRRAVQRALDLTPPQGSVLITGSLFLVGEVKRLFPEWSG